MYLLAGNVFNWKVQHNVLHHTFTNIQDHDEDIDAGRVIRFSKHAKWLKIHKIQNTIQFSCMAYLLELGNYNRLETNAQIFKAKIILRCFKPNYRMD